MIARCSPKVSYFASYDCALAFVARYSNMPMKLCEAARVRERMNSVSCHLLLNKLEIHLDCLNTSHRGRFGDKINIIV